MHAHQHMHTLPRRLAHRPVRHSLTGEPLLLHTGVLHRVDTRQLPPDQGVSMGGLCHPEQHNPCTQKTARPGPEHARPAKVDRRARALFWRGYLLFLAAVLGSLAWWLTH